MAVPFATGGGAIVKVASRADDVIDLGRTVDKVTDVADTVHDGTKALSKLEIPDCFVAGTIVTTSEGEKPIEKVQAGDYVWASDPETGEVGLKQVVKTFVNETTHVTKITVNGEEITSTQTHPYYVADKGWVLAKNLRAGDILVMLNGEHVVLEQVQHEILESPVVTYNFEVEDFHTYYVGENEILVHNKCIDIVALPEVKKASQIKVSDTVDVWNDYLGPNQTNINKFTGKIDMDRIFSADGTKSIRFGRHEMNSIGTSKAHFHFEVWDYNPSTRTVYVRNFLQRLK